MIYSVSNNAPPAGMKPWTAAERDRLLAECAAVHEVTGKPGTAKPSARADNHGWDRIIAAVMDPSRVKADRP